MTILYTFICLLVASAIAATTFILGRQVGYTQRNAEYEQERVKSMTEQLDFLDMEYKQLRVQYEQERKDNDRTYVRPGGWNPAQLNERD